MKITNKQNKSALSYMLITVVLHSLLPIAFVIGAADKAPFLFSGLVFLFSGISSIIYLFVQYKHLLNHQTYNLIRKHLWNSSLIWFVASFLNYVIFAFALRFVDASIAAILIETSPIFMIIFMTQIFKGADRYEPIAKQEWALFLLAFIGITFIVTSQSQTINKWYQLFDANTLIGCGLLIITAILRGLAVPTTIMWGNMLSKKTQNNDHANQIFFTIVAGIIGRISSSIIFLIIAVVLGESIHAIKAIGITSAALYGFFAAGFAGITVRIANIKTSSLSINALFYLTPAVSLIWLGLASKIDVPRIDWLIVGLVLIIFSNILLNYKTNTHYEQ